MVVLVDVDVAANIAEDMAESFSGVRKSPSSNCLKTDSNLLHLLLMCSFLSLSFNTVNNGVDVS